MFKWISPTLLFFISLMAHVKCYDVAFCSSRGIGYYADPTTCYQYYYCDGVSTNSFTCSLGTMWDQSTLNCVVDLFSGACVSALVDQDLMTYDVYRSVRYTGPVMSTRHVSSILGCARECYRHNNLGVGCGAFNFFTTGNCDLIQNPITNSLSNEPTVTFGKIK